MNIVPRVALLGLGGYGRHHLAALNSLQSVGLCQLTGVYDPFAAAHADAVAALQNQNTRVDGELETLLRRDDVDAVFIASPIPFHAPQTIAALQAGKHVYLEKPPCSTLDEWARMNEAQLASGQMCAIGFQMQSSGALRFLKAQLDNNAIGPLRQLWTSVRWRRSDVYYARSPWAGRWHLEGAPVFDGPATNALAHAVFALLSLAVTPDDPLARVRGNLKRARPIESYDSAFLEAETARGIQVRVALTHASAAHDEVILRVRGENGTAEVSWAGRVTLQSGQMPAQTWHFVDDAPLSALLDFWRAQQQPRRAPQVSLRETLPYLQLVNGALQSAHGAGDFAPDLIEHIVTDNADNFYQVRGLDGQMAVFAADFDAPPPLLCADENAWLRPDELQGALPQQLLR